jgi:hypothetical protein
MSPDTAKKLVPQITRPLRHRGNHRYAWALDHRLRQELPASPPYPKAIDEETAA